MLTDIVFLSRYPSDKEMLENLRRSNPEIAEAASKKDDKLHDRLKEVCVCVRKRIIPSSNANFSIQVFVTSKDPEDFDPDSLKQIEHPDRPLPKRTVNVGGGDVIHPYSLDLGNLPHGRVSLSTAQEILSQFRPPKELQQAGTEKLTVADIVKEHGISAGDAEGLTRHYAVFTMYQKEGSELKLVKDPLLPQPDWEEAPPPEERDALPPTKQIPGKKS